MIQKNYELYLARREPAVLTRLNYGRSLPHYPPIRQITDKKVIIILIKELERLMGHYVVMSWVSPPDNRVVGYGIYKKYEADEITNRNDEEKWDFPQVGRQYDKNKLENKLKKSVI